MNIGILATIFLYMVYVNFQDLGQMNTFFEKVNYYAEDDFT